MTELTANEFFTKKHARLWRIASISNIAAWIVVIVFTVAVIAKIIGACVEYRSTTLAIYSLIGAMTIDPLYFTNIVIDIASTALRGVVYFLVLEGASLGLNMILETDLNYRGKSQEESHE